MGFDSIPHWLRFISAFLAAPLGSIPVAVLTSATAYFMAPGSGWGAVMMSLGISIRTYLIAAFLLELLVAPLLFRLWRDPDTSVRVTAGLGGVLGAVLGLLYFVVIGGLTVRSLGAVVTGAVLSAGFGSLAGSACATIFWVVAIRTQEPLERR